MTRGQDLYCRDILECIAFIETYVGEGKDAFLQSRLLQQAANYNFILIGEAVKRLDERLIARQPHIDWRGFARFRDVLVHRYHGTEARVVWMAADKELPALKAAIVAMLETLEGED